MDTSIKPVPDLDGALRNIVQVLQTDPLHYRNFSWRWYSVKAMLKRHGYTTEQFYGLGEYIDHEAMSHVEPGPDASILAWALDLYGHNARLNMGSADGYLDDGTAYQIFDRDINQ